MSAVVCLLVGWTRRGGALSCGSRPSLCLYFSCACVATSVVGSTKKSATASDWPALLWRAGAHASYMQQQLFGSFLQLLLGFDIVTAPSCKASQFAYIRRFEAQAKDAPGIQHNAIQRDTSHHSATRRHGTYAPPCPASRSTATASPPSRRPPPTSTSCWTMPRASSRRGHWSRRCPRTTSTISMAM